MISGRAKDSEMNETKPKRMVSRKVALALGMICIVLLFFSIVAIFQITKLQNQVTDLNTIVNFQKVDTWLNNKTVTINPNQNDSELFSASLGGNVEVEGSVHPATLYPYSYWINLSWVVTYSEGSSTGPIYTVYPTPSIRNAGPDYFDYEFPIVSFGQTWASPNVKLEIGNNLNYSSITTNITVTFTY